MLNGLLFILIVVLVVIAVAVMVVAQMVFRGFNRLRNAARQAMGSDPLSDGAGDRRRQGGGGGTTVIDGRKPEHAQRKIFSHDEGEYVDFEEEK